MALRALIRVDDGAYLNLAMSSLLEQTGLERRDRAFATELAYGAVRMRRACDWLIDAHLDRRIEPAVRAALRLGTYQLAFLGTPPHAAVSATVAEVPQRVRGFTNAVLRRVASDSPPPWPDDATRLSYPDWVVDRLVSDLGRAVALAALAEMDQPARASRRADGYVQDESSQRVADLVGAGPGERVLDVCSAPGGKATALARRVSPALAVAVELNPSRAGVVRDNARALGLANLATVAADGARLPFSGAVFDRVLVDAPCTGLGALRRRPDARWRIDEGAVGRLATTQRRLLDSAATMVRPGGTLVFSVCTLTTDETVGIDEWAARALPGFMALDAPGPPWIGHGRGGLLLPGPGVVGVDGMYCLRLGAPSRGR